MLNTNRIQKTLSFLEREYNKHISSYERERPMMYSKLGVLELCGWIEEGFDEIARNFVRRKLRTSRAPDILEKKIRHTHGFTYKAHSRELLAVALGTVRLLEIEKILDRDGSLSLLKSELGNLNNQRKSAAHTFIQGATSTFDSPSVTINRFHKVKPIFQKLWDMGRS